MFRNKSILNIFIVILCMGILFPCASIYIINPYFSSLLIDGFEEQALNLAVHLSERYFPDNTPLTPKNAYLISEYADRHMKDFNLMKLKIFSSTGEVIYSTNKEDIGRINTDEYFHNIVSTGRPFTKVVTKDTTSMEGEKVIADVVETYVPVMSGAQFNGAMEIYYDITNNYKKLNSLVLKSWTLHIAMTIAGLVLTIIILFKLDHAMTRRKNIEGELKAYAQRLQKSNRELQDFAHIASHDLQEPLRKITAFGDRLKARHSDVLGEQGSDYLERMQNAAGHMQHLIEGLLAFSRVTTKANPLEAVDLATVAQGVLSDLEMRINDTGGHVEIGRLPTVSADPVQMRQLFQNLISNALKFHKKDQTPVVKVSTTLLNGNGENPTDEKYYQIAFEDNGIGFDEQYTERIFGVFQRLHGRKEYEGSGIGLSICKKIAERHGGNISAKSTPGEGATFIVTLPVKQEEGGNHG